MSRPTSKTEKNVDRISLLPDSLIHHVLSFLDTKVVVQTCVLSKRWRTVWTRIPTLNFDYYSYRFEGLSGNAARSKETSFQDFIFRVLSECCGRCITKLRYTSSDHDDEKTVRVVELLISYARCHMVQEIYLNTNSVEYKDWPYCLATCSSLTVLKMVCGFVDGWGSLTSPSLRILELYFAWDYQTDNHEKYKGIKMLSGCPNLESLVLVDFCFESISICAPKLEHFELYIDFDWKISFPEVELLAPSLKNVKFNNILPSVKSTSEFLCIDKVNIDVEDYDFERQGLYIPKETKNISELLRVFHNARSFTLPLKRIEELMSIPSSVSGSSFQNLKHLKLTTEEQKKMLVIGLPTIAFLQNCPNFEKLMIDPIRREYRTLS